jgi:hypothetical protein
MADFADVLETLGNLEQGGEIFEINPESGTMCQCQSPEQPDL